MQPFRYYMEMFDDQLINKISIELGIDKITAKCLINAGCNTIEDCNEFMYPSLKNLTKVFEYDGIKEAVDRIKIAITNKEKIVIYGDYDCDGVCATAILYLYLKSKGLDVNIYIPDRHTEGYGMNQDSLEYIAEQYLPDLLISVDCGINSVDEVEYIQEVLGFDVIVTDHHEIPDVLPQCIIFNPHLSNRGQFESLCGAGVVLRLIEAIDGFNESLKYYDIAAIATIADLVPLVKDNRIIVKKGLEIINNSPRKGLDLLIKTFTKEKLTSQDVAFKLAPRINAVGRLDKANKLIDLFEYDDYFIIKSLVDEIVELNNKRQQLTKEITKKVEEQLETYDFNKYPIIVLYNKNWDEGIIGIVAAKIMTQYNHPVILFTQSGEQIKGSGRSLPNVNIFECINSTKALLTKFGGHPQACGLSLNIENFNLFKESINEYCRNYYDNEVFLSYQNDYYNFLDIKNPIKVAKELELLQPYGEGNKKPEFFAIVNYIKFNRMKPQSEHIVYKNKNLQIIGFYMDDKLNILNSNIEKKLIFDLSLNFYNNIETAQCIIKGIECKDVDNIVLNNYLNTALFNDNSIFKPKQITLEDAKNIINGFDYGTAYICYCKETFESFKKVLEKNIYECSYFVNTNCPNNTIFFNFSETIDLTKYSNVVFLDRPISLGFIDVILLNKNCKVYYVNSENALKNLSKYLIEYSQLGKVYIEIVNSLNRTSYADVFSLYMDIEKRINLNYNNFVVALYIFFDLGILYVENKCIKVNKTKKNPLANSNLYQKILGAK